MKSGLDAMPLFLLDNLLKAAYLEALLYLPRNYINQV